MTEKWDFEEVEIKVKPAGRDDRLVELVRAASPAGGLSRKPHVSFFDVYLDSSRLELLDAGAYLRVRFGERAYKGKKKKRFKLFFKESDAAADDPWMSRREVRTDVAATDLLAYSTRLSGLAADLAFEILPPGTTLVPTCVIGSAREYYSLRSATAGSPDLLNLSIERSRAWSPGSGDFERLVGSGTVDWPHDRESVTFDLAEVELTAEADEARAAFERVAELLTAEFELIDRPKYATCVDALRLRDLAARFT